MASSWMILLAVLSPAVAGVATLFLPLRQVTLRVAIAAAGPALAFLLLLSFAAAHGIAGRPAPHADHADAIEAPADHAEAPEAESDHETHSSHLIDLADDSPSADHHAAADPGHAEATTIPAPEATRALPWVPSLNLNIAFLFDGLGGFFALLVSGVGVLIVLYARGYFGKTEAAQRDLFRFYPTLGFFATAMLGVVLADYTLLTLLFWELTSISSFLLIGWDRYDKHAVKLAKQAFFTTGLGGMGLLGGIALFGATTGVWRWSDMFAHAGEIDFAQPAVLWAFVLMFIGAASKSAQWPLHYWLPGAMAAPTPVSAYLHSATMVKAGVFLVGRLFPVFAPSIGGGLDIWPGLITWIGTVTMLYGAVTAVNQHDLKRIFAYTTVSQLGLLMAMYGLGGFTYHGVPTIDFDITQIANHAFYKAPLFITAGAIGHVASRSLPELFGAFHKHKAICLTMLLAGYALAAGPFTISFQAKELFLYAIVHAADAHPWMWLVLLLTIATAACNVAIFVRLLTTLMGWRFGLKAPAARDDHHDDDHHGDHHHEHEHGLGGALIWLPAVPLVALQYLGGIITPLWNLIFLPFEKYRFYEAFHGRVPSLLHAVLHPSLPLVCSLIAIALGIVLGLSKLLRGQHTDVNDRLYPAVEAGSVAIGRRLFAMLQNGSLRSYVVMVLLAFFVAFIAAVANEPGMAGLITAAAGDAFESPLGVLLGVIICVSALLIPVVQSRVVRILLLGSCGFTVVAMYIVYQAPDLVLTQLMVEIISVLLFVLVLRLLPAEAGSRQRIGWAWRGGVALAAGLIFGWMTLVAIGDVPSERLGEWFTQYTYHGPAVEGGDGYERGGGGFNVVNVILVDFRGFDTFGEITVLGLAALGVWSMLPGRRKELDR